MQADRGPLPPFRYHPDPVATGSVVAEEVVCVCCGRQRPFTYVGPVYAVEELGRRLCPWCVADGQAASLFDAQFTEVGWRVPDDVAAEVTEEVLQRTPGFAGWQQERWLHHCGDAAEFHGPVGAAELAAFPDALECVRLEVRGDGGWSAEQVEGYVQSLSKDGQPTAYLFRCRRCGAHLAYSDFV
ncbi:CbrC family protein [Krasilnikovia cinnamomea]|uniref:CbrC family protein n=1 Tax=Krasilnikovia cinnamomea TaxID=349313 RepID=UPI00102B5050|nr:CbrC family protein [Krasilnikovia cinnamomea]